MIPILEESNWSNENRFHWWFWCWNLLNFLEISGHVVKLFHQGTPPNLPKKHNRIFWQHSVHRGLSLASKTRRDCRVIYVERQSAFKEGTTPRIKGGSRIWIYNIYLRQGHALFLQQICHLQRKNIAVGISSLFLHAKCQDPVICLGGSPLFVWVKLSLINGIPTPDGYGGYAKTTTAIRALNGEPVRIKR